MPRKSLRRAAVVAVATACVLPGAGQAAYQRPGQTVRILGYNGQAQDPVEAAIGLSSWQNAISGDGRYLAFTSTATNLVPNDVNNAADVFVYDRVTRRVERASVSSDEVPAAGPCASSGSPSISASGRYVAFWSCAANLVPGDLNAATDIFVRDRVAGTTRMVSTKANGGQAMLPVTGHASGGAPSISPEGRYVSFGSQASDLVPGDTNDKSDVFLKDLETGAIQRVSVSSTGTQSNDSSVSSSVSADGRYVAFPSYGNTLVPDDTNNAIDVFVRDVRARKTERVSLRSGGLQGSASGASGLAATGGRAISADGRYVMVSSTSTTFVPNDSNGTFDIFVWDRKTKRMQRVSVGSDAHQADGSSSPGALSLDGRYVVTASSANDLTPGDTGLNGSDTVTVGRQPGDVDVYLYDTKFMTMEMLSVAPDGTEAKGLCGAAGNLLSSGSGESFGPTVSADGAWVGFQSCANNLAPGDTNGTRDEFLRHRGPHVGTAVVTTKGGSSVAVSGWSTFTGAVLTTATDPATDGAADDPLNGSELIGGRLLYRAEQQDLFLVLDLKQIPQLGVSLTGLTAPGDPRVVYGTRFTANGTTYEVRVQRAGANVADPLNAAMGLFECTEVVCTEVASLRGGYGTTGEQIAVSIPLSLMTRDGKALAEGGVLSSPRAFTGYGTYYGGATELLDQLILSKQASVTLPRKSVKVTARGVSRTVTPTNGRFSATLPRSAFRGLTAVVVTSCLGRECRSLTTAVRV